MGRGFVFIYLKGIWVLKISNNHNYAYFRMNLRVISGDVNFYFFTILSLALGDLISFCVLSVFIFFLFNFGA